MEKGLSNKGNRVYLKNGKNVKMPGLWRGGRMVYDWAGEESWT